MFPCGRGWRKSSIIILLAKMEKVLILANRNIVLLSIKNLLFYQDVFQGNGIALSK